MSSKSGQKANLQAVPGQVMQQMRPESLSEEPTAQATIICHIMLLESVLDRTANRVTEAHDLTLSQWMALGCISSAGETGITHSELSRRLMLSKAPITGVVDRLQRADYVQRVADKKDRRVSRIIITEEGLQHWMNVRLDLIKHSDELFSNFSQVDQDTLLALLSKLLSAAAKDDPTLADIHCSTG